MPAAPRYPVRTLADLIVAATQLTVDARLQAGRKAEQVRFARPIALALVERTAGNGAPRRVLTIEIEGDR